MIVIAVTAILTADRGEATGAICPGPSHLAAVGVYYIFTRSKYSNRTVILIQHLKRYSVDNYTGINCRNCSHIQSQRSSYSIILKNFLRQSERVPVYNKYCDYC